MTQFQEQKEFFSDFSSKTGDTVTSVELASIQADKNTYQALGLNLPAGKIELWGLIVFCTHSLYFYAAPSENYLTAMMRQASHEKPPAEQLICLSSLEEFTTAVPARRWYSFIFSDLKYRIDASFKRDGSVYYFSFTTHKPAPDINRQLQAYTAR
jgi:hypothetical protein